MRSPSPASQPVPANQDQPIKNTLATATSTTPSVNNAKISWPIIDALSRVTKKPFGLQVSPDHSPVSPERFSGYHTGVDFETTPAEQDVAVPVYAICAGPVVLKKIATGYGGVVVQSCKIETESVTVIYGHLRLTSVSAALDTSLDQGQQIGVLGQGYSLETAGERKHLHLGIHRGSAISLLGYVPDKNELSQWIDFLTLVQTSGIKGTATVHVCNGVNPAVMPPDYQPCREEVLAAFPLLIKNNGSGVEKRVVTDSGGKFFLELSPGQYTIIDARDKSEMGGGIFGGPFYAEVKSGVFTAVQLKFEAALP